MQPLFRITLFVFVVTMPANFAFGGILIGGGEVSRELYTINVHTGARDPLFSAGFNRLNGIAYNTRNSKLYATTTDVFRYPDPRSSTMATWLLEIDQVNLVFERFVLLFPNRIDGLAYDPSTDVLWGSSPSNGQLVRIDPYIRTFSVVDFPRLARISGLAFDSQTTTLYGVEDSFTGIGEPSSLVTIDTSTGEITQIGQPGLGLGLSDLVLARSSSGIGGAEFVRDFVHDFGFRFRSGSRG